MDNSKNMEPDIRNAASQGSPNREQRKKEGRAAISAKAQTILDFLRGCSPLRGRFHTGNGRLRDGQRRYRND